MNCSTSQKVCNSDTLRVSETERAINAESITIVGPYVAVVAPVRQTARRCRIVQLVADRDQNPVEARVDDLREVQVAHDLDPRIPELATLPAGAQNRIGIPRVFLFDRQIKQKYKAL